MIAELIRLEESLRGTIGILKLNKEVFCFTMEPPDHENERNISSIPTGQYICKPWNSTNYGKTWMVADVYRRNGILFHPGNYVGNTQGCILLGSEVGKLLGDRAILNSGKTFKEFMIMTEGERLKDESDFHLTISEVY